MPPAQEEPLDKRLSWFETRLVTAWKLKPLETKKMFENEDYRTLLTDFCDKDCRSVFITQLPTGGYGVFNSEHLSDPAGKHGYDFRRKVFYFMKPKPKERLGDDKTMSLGIVFGDITVDVLQSLNDFYADVGLPLMRNRKAVERQVPAVCVAEMMEQTHDFTGSTLVTMGRAHHLTLLPLPALKLPPYVNPTTANANKALILSLENTITQWTELVREAIDAAPEKALPPLLRRPIGPLDEIGFWKGKAANLMQLEKQLCQPFVVKSVVILKMSDSHFYPAFASLINELHDSLEEATEVYRYLKPLTETLELINVGAAGHLQPESISQQKVFRQLFHFLFLIWTNCPRFATIPKMANFIFEIANDVIDNARENLNVMDIFSTETEEIQKQLASVLTFCGEFKAAFFLYKARTVKELQRPWRFQNSTLFRRMDAFLERCHDLLDFIDVSGLFFRLVNLKIGTYAGIARTSEIEEIMNAFAKKHGELQTVQYDLLNVDDDSFDKDYEKFRLEVRELEKQLGNIMNLSIEDTGNGLPNLFKVVESFEGFTERPLLHQQWADRQLSVLRSWHRELLNVQEIFNADKDQPPAFPNVPPVTCAILWTNALTGRIGNAYPRIMELDKSILQSDLGREAIALYESLKGALRAYAHGQYENWAGGVGQLSQEKLQLFLLARHPDPPNEYRTNFDPALVRTLRESAYVESFAQDYDESFVIPPQAAALSKQRDTLRGFVLQLDYVCETVNALERALLPCERALFSRELAAIEVKLMRGLQDLRWRQTESVEVFLADIVSDVSTLERTVETMHSNTKRMRDAFSDILVQDTLLPLQSTKTDVKILSEADFRRKWFAEHTIAREAKFKAANELVSQLVTETLESINGPKSRGGNELISADSVQWATYLEHVSGEVEEALTSSIVGSLKLLRDQMDDKWLSAHNGLPLFEMRLTLSKPGKEEAMSGVMPSMIFEPALKGEDGKGPQSGGLARQSTMLAGRKTDFAKLAKEKAMSLQSLLSDVIASIIHQSSLVSRVVVADTSALEAGGTPSVTFETSIARAPAVMQVVQEIDELVRTCSSSCTQFSVRFDTFKDLYLDRMDQKFQAFLEPHLAAQKPAVAEGDQVKKDENKGGEENKEGAEQQESAEKKLYFDAPLSEFQAQIRRFEELQGEVQELPQSTIVSFIKLDCKPLRSALEDLCGKWRTTFSSFITTRILTDLQDLYDFMQSLDQELGVEVAEGDVEALKRVMRCIRECKRRDERVRQMMEPISEAAVMLLRHPDSVPADVHAKIEELRKPVVDSWSALFRKSLNVREQNSIAQDREAERIKEDVAKFEEVDIGALAKDMRRSELYEFTVDPPTSYVEIDRWATAINDLERRGRELRDLQMLFDLQPTDFREIRECRAEMVIMKNVWDLVNHVTFMFKDWLTSTFSTVDVDGFLDEIKRLNKLLKTQSIKAKAWNVFKGLEQEVVNMGKSLPLCAELRSPAMRARHWDQLLRVANASGRIDPDDANFTLQRLISLGIHNVGDDILGIVEQAQKELQIEKALVKIADAWEKLFVSYDNNATLDIMLLGSVDHIVEQLELDTLILQGMLANRFVEYFVEKVNMWQKYLGAVDTCINKLAEIQRKWVNLYPIFVLSADIREQLQDEARNFGVVDELFRSLMRVACKETAVIPLLCTKFCMEGLHRGEEDLESYLQQMEDILVSCENALSEYLEMKRKIFPRFFFVSNADLVDILSKGSNPKAVMVHMAKIIDSIDTFTFDDNPAAVPGIEMNPKQVWEMVSVQAEKVKLSEDYICEGPVEHWLEGCVKVMQRSVKMHILEANAGYVDKPRTEWIYQYCCQAIIVASRTWYTAETQQAFQQMEEGNDNGMKDFLKAQRSQLDTLVKEVLLERKKQDRAMLVHLITIDVHNRDIIQQLVDERVDTSEAFRWQSQLRYYIDEGHGSVVRICDAEFKNGYEYIGLCGCLVVTKLTDRCYITLSQALKLYKGGAPAGPAGTGKTETTKDLARNLGIACIAAGTLVTLEDGSTKAIETIVPGDRVLTWNRDRSTKHNGHTCLGGLNGTEVTALLNQGVKECVELTFSDGRTVTCTPDHRFLLTDGTWCRADQIPLLRQQLKGADEARNMAAVGNDNHVLGVVAGPVGTKRAHGPDQRSRWELKLKAQWARTSSRRTDDPIEPFDIKAECELERARAAADARKEGNSAVLRRARRRQRNEEDGEIDDYGTDGIRLDNVMSPVDFLELIGTCHVFNDPHTERDGVAYSLPRHSNDKNKECALPTLKAFLLDRRPAGTRHVYDLSVEHQTNGADNSFLVNGVVAHNCYVFNCSSEMTNVSLGQIFKGLAMSGSWGCFDEFNRISVEVLSVVATQVGSILNGLKANKKRFRFEKEEINLEHTVGMFITMNPGYAGRTELPENIKALFRPCAMCVPDLKNICEIMLAAEGFLDAKDLALKFVTLYKLNKELLSPQDHYDWGLRAVKSVLYIAGNLKRGDPDVPERKVLLRALRDTNMAKLSRDDVYVFMGLIKALFPQLEVSKKEKPELSAACKQACKEMQNLPGENDIFITKCLQYEELMNVRHSVFILGPAGCGKTQCWKCLQKGLTILGDKCASSVLSPNAISTQELYGFIHPATKEWREGILSTVFKAFSVESKTKKNSKWLVLDGIVNAEWIESMNTVMDDNKMLTLVNNDRIPLTASMRLIIEVSHLKFASPATVSRGGVLFINESDLGFFAYKDKWLASRKDDRESIQLEALFERYLGPVFEYYHRTLKPIVQLMDIGIVQSITFMLEALLLNLNRDTPSDVYEKYFCFAVIWAFGGPLPSDGRIDYRTLFSNWWRKEFPTVRFGETGTVFDFFLDASDRYEYKPWSQLVVKYHYDPDVPLSNVVVQTADTVRMNYLMSLLIDHGRPVMMVGTSGTGKSNLMLNKLRSLDNTVYTFRTVAFNARTGSTALQAIMEQNLEKRTGRQFGPIGRKKLVFFLDDVNMPTPDKYGTQDAIAFLQQHYEHGFWYDRQKIIMKEVSDVRYCAAMNPKSGTFTILDRLLRQFTVFSANMPDRSDLVLIYGQILDAHLREKPFSRDVKDVGEPITQASIALHLEIAAKFLPNAVLFHYQWNMRELFNVFQGVCNSHPKLHTTPEQLYRLWHHECCRVFRDRMARESDIAKFNEIMAAIQKTHFPDVGVEKWAATQTCVWAPFGTTKDGEEGISDEIDVNAANTYLVNKLESYNQDNAVMDLVLFSEAVQHVCRICRIISNPRGNALLVGVGGSGKQSLARLASYICGYDTYQIAVTGSYTINDFRGELSELYKKTGIKQQQFTFLITDLQIVNQDMLVYLNDMLSSGNIPDLFSNDDRDGIIGGITNEVKAAGVQDYGNPDTCWQFFINRVRQNLHTILCFSPLSKTFSTWCRQFPALSNTTCIDWFWSWPLVALQSVARRFLSEIDVLADDAKLRGEIADFMANTHLNITEQSEEFFQQTKRRCYTTPKSFLELISLYRTLFARKRSGVQDKTQRLVTGLEKIRDAGSKVAQLQAVLQKESIEVEEARMNTMQLMEKVGHEKAIVQEQSALAETEEAKTNKIVVEVEAFAAECKKDLDAAQPLVQEALAALKTLDKASLTELKSMTKPPDDVNMVVTAVKVLTSDPRRIPPVRSRDWNSAKLIMANVSSWMDSLVGFDVDNIPPACIDAIQMYITNPGFNATSIVTKSFAAAGLCKWVIAMNDYYKVRCDVKPKEERLKEAQERLAASRAALKKIQDKVNDLKAKLDALLADYNDAVSAANAIEAKARKTRDKMSLAERLVNGLADEKVRWGKLVESLKVKETLLIGDTLIASAFVSYAGPFSREYRERTLQELWKPEVKERGIPCTDNVDIMLGILTSDAEVASWNNEGLPSDPISTENGAIVTNCSRWPLMIDPQLQGVKWIRTREGPNKLVATQQGGTKWLQKVTACVEEGLPCLIEGLGDTIDPVLDNVLSRATYRRGTRTMIRIGSQDVEFNPKFRLILQTKLSNPIYKPEVNAQTTLINFMVTESGLEDQLLAVVVSQERPDLEAKRAALLHQMNTMVIELQQCEDGLLFELSNATGDILENVALVEKLEATKKKAIEINRSMKLAKETEISIVASRQTYRPVAARGSLIYFQIDMLCKIDHMYQYSLEAFMVVFNKALIKAEQPANPKDLVKRVENVARSVTESVFAYVARGLFERHKLIFSSLLTFSILGKEGKIDQRHFDFLVRGKRKTGYNRPEPVKEFVSDANWGSVMALAEVDGTNPSFQILPSDIADSARWKQWCETEKPEDEKLPQAWKDLTQFQRLLVLRALRPDRLTAALEDFVAKSLGKFFVTDQAVDVAVSYQDSGPTTPLFFILSPGVDPSKSVQALGEKLGFTFDNDKYFTVSLGQGQEVVADEALLKCFKEGGWVLLSNIHLVANWLKVLDKTMDKFSNVYTKMAQMAKQRADAKAARKLARQVAKMGLSDDASDDGDDKAGAAVAAAAAAEGAADKSAAEGDASAAAAGGENSGDQGAAGGDASGADAKKAADEANAAANAAAAAAAAAAADDGGDAAARSEEGEEQEAEEEQESDFEDEEEVEFQDDEGLGKGSMQLRVFLSAEPSDVIPQGILQRCIKLTSEPPTGIAQNVNRALMNFSDDPWEKSAKPTEFRCITFAMCFFHSVIVERKKFGPQGWNRVYPFNVGDLTTCVDVLINYIEDRPKVPWEDLRYVFGEIMYGGHITDDWDRILCMAYLNKLVNPDVTDAMDLAPGFPVPPAGNYQDYVNYVDQVCPPESPVLYGLHPNAEINYRTVQADTLFKSIAELQPKKAIKRKKGDKAAAEEGKQQALDPSTPDEIVKAKLDELLDKSPEQINMVDITERLDEDRTPPQHVFFQEIERMNKLLGEIRRALHELDLGLKGALSMSADMQLLFDELFLDKVPSTFKRYSFDSLRNLGGWHENLNQRYQQLFDWTGELATPKVTMLHLFFNPMSFLTAIMQQTSMQNNYDLDQMSFVIEVTKKAPDQVDIPARDGAFIYGLHMEGARWDSGLNSIDDSRMKELYPRLPVVHIKAVPSAKADYKQCAEVPCYRTQQRGFTIVLGLHFKTKQPPRKWIIAGVAIILDIVE